jgi:DNA processing protein
MAGMWTPDDLPYWVAWSRPGDMRGKLLLKLFERFGTLKDAWHAPAHAVRGLVPERFIEARATCDPLRAWDQVQRAGMRVLASPDPDFPERLRRIDEPPALLYVRGHLPSFDRAVAIIGARAATPYGQRIARRLGRDLSRAGGLVVSGAAAGIDTAAHWGALEAGPTVAVLGCGLDHVYPASNARLYNEIEAKGALISELGPHERASRHTFPLRNRLITGLSHGVVVVEAGLKSGTSGTVTVGNDQGRTIFAVPGPVDSPASMGTNALIRDLPIKLVTSAEDILSGLGWEIQVVQPATPTGAFERRVLDLLAGGPRYLDVLLGPEPPAQAALALLQLELAGLIVRMPGQRYARA